MNLLILGIVIFYAGHLVSVTPLKAALKARLGEGGYKGLFSVVAVIGLGLMIKAYLGTRSGPEAVNFLYLPPDWTRHVTMLLVLLAFISLAASFHRGRLKLWLRNPFSIAIALWATGHLLSNGKTAAVWLFGSFLLFALFDIVRNTLVGQPPKFTPKPIHDLIAVVAGVLLYGLFLFGFHPYVLNLPVVG